MNQDKTKNRPAALHADLKRRQDAEIRAKVIAMSDEIFDRYVSGESMRQISKTLPFKCPAWKLREILMNSQETAETYATSAAHRAHHLVETALEFGTQAAAIGDASGLRAAIDVNLKVASKLHAAEYGDSKKVELTGAGGGPVKLMALTDEELLRIAAQGIKEGGQ